VVVVDFATGRPIRQPSQKAAWDLQTVLAGSVASRPVVIYCHLRGQGDPYPPSWKWGQLTIHAGPPVWRRWGLGRNRARVTIPEGSFVTGTPRPIMRDELSAFCPNPRRSLVVPVQTPDGPLLIGVPRHHAPTVVAAVGTSGPRPTPLS
jgi:hypothetical protein